MSRPRKGPHIYRRPGRPGWWAYLDRDHKDHALSTEDETEALARLSELIQRFRIPGVAQGTRLAELSRVACERARTGGTRKTAYERGRDLARVITWLESQSAFVSGQLSLELVEAYKKHRHVEQGRSAARVNRELDAWKRLAEIAVERVELPVSCLEWFAHLREPRPQPHQVGLTRAELDRFLLAELHPGFRAMFRTVIGTGIRDDEMRHLARTDLQGAVINIGPKKPGTCPCCPKGWASKAFRYREIPVTPETTEAAREFLKVRPTLYLDPKYIWKRIQKARKAAKISKSFSMHDLRRAWASHMLAAGHRVERISKWLGHADVITTMRYLRIVDEAMPKPEELPF